MIFEFGWRYILEPNPVTGVPIRQSRRFWKADWGSIDGGGILLDRYGVPVRGYLRAGRVYAVNNRRYARTIWWRSSDKGVEYAWEGDPVWAGHLADKALLYGEGFLPLRVQVKALRQQDVREISPEEAAYEGMSVLGFLAYWAKKYDPKPPKPFLSVYHYSGRPADYYQALVVEFEPYTAPRKRPYKTKPRRQK